MNAVDKIRKENFNYLAHDKKCNKVDLALYEFYDFVEEYEGQTEQEEYILQIMEKEINALRYSIECFKKEHDQAHYDRIEQLKKED